MSDDLSGSDLLDRSSALQNTILDCRHVHPNDLDLHARSFHNAAKLLAGSLQSQTNPFTDFDACPVVFIYRQAIELHLKALVLGEGRNFLVSKVEPSTIYRTHSIRRLVQLVCEIVKQVEWEQSFKCDGVADIVEFRSILCELYVSNARLRNAKYAMNADADGAVQNHPAFTVLAFVRRMNAVIDLLAVTMDALAVEWDMRSEMATHEASSASAGS